jgi:hypothetical protein
LRSCFLITSVTLCTLPTHSLKSHFLSLSFFLPPTGGCDYWRAA